MQIDFPLDRIPNRTPFRQFRQWLRDKNRVTTWEQSVVLKRLQRAIGARDTRMLVCPQDALSVRLIDRAAQSGCLAYVTWVMDDHELQEGGGRLEYTPEFGPLWEKHLRGARHVFVISNAMQAFYKERFGVASTVLHGAAPKRIPVAATASPGSLVSEKRLKLGYAGSAFGWQEDQLRLLAASLQDANAELRYAGNKPPTWLQCDSVKYHGRLAPTDALEMLRVCDATVLPMSFRSEYAALSRLNIATKLSELCALGRPILAIGPANAAMVTELASRNAAICVTEPTRAALLEGIMQLRNEEQAGSTAAQARRWFDEEVNLEEMQRRWRPIAQWIFGGHI